MLDIKFIRENTKTVKDSILKRGMKVDVDKLLVLDSKKRKLGQEIESISAQKNKANKEIATSKDKKKIISKMRAIDKKGDKLKAQYKKIVWDFNKLLYTIPNVIAKDVPSGRDESDNKIIKTVGTTPKFSFPIKDHLELGEKLDIIDIKRAAKVSGSRFNYFKGKLVILELALTRYTIDVLGDQKIISKIAKKAGVSDKIFTPVIPPVMIKPDVYRKMARLNDDDIDERYYLEKDDLYLIGSAEHTLGPMHMDETINEKELPIRYVGVSLSFRREAGSYGKDTRGILRVHQFSKIEMETLTTKENSLKEQNFIIALQEYLVSSLKIPYRVVMISSGDMGIPDFRQVDIECWIPSQNKYRETHTADLMTDYQARRLNTRVKRKDKTEFVHMNDATAFAMSRTPIAIMENFQQKDGSIKIPTVLHKYTGFKEIN